DCRQIKVAVAIPPQDGVRPLHQRIRQVEKPMNAIAPRRSHILVTHTDPPLCAGLLTALRQHAAFEISVVDAATADRVVPPIDVVIADYDDALRLGPPSSSAPHLPLAKARILALTSNDREADIRR